MKSLTLPTFDAVPDEINRARALQVAEDISTGLRAPLTSIDARARRLENDSPLFRNSGANGQWGLFAELAPAAPAARVPGYTVRHFARCDGATVQLGDFGICPNCGDRHKTLRRIKFSNEPSSHGCDPRCMGATGFDCECSCGGVNHGCWNDAPADDTETESLF